MNKLEQATANIKGWVNNYKGAIIATSIAVTSSIVMVTILGSAKRDTDIKSDIESRLQFDPGRELEMQFIDTETGEVLGRGGCYEVYMNDVIDIISGI